ncbi:MAG: PilN domain-containing protein [Acetobacterium sp.]|nr:PilN domain-containing protein [Acetobacterium sp.]
MKHQMNLLPVAPAKKKREDKPKITGRIFFIGLFLAVLAIYGILAFLDRCCQNEIKQIEAIIADKSDYQVIYSNLSHQKAVLEHRQLILESISKEKELPLQTMVEIDERLPVGVRLSNYDFQDGRLIISGETQKKEAIMEFKEKLSGGTVFKTINMVNTIKKEETATDIKKAGGEEVWEFTFDIEVIGV